MFVDAMLCAQNQSPTTIRRPTIGVAFEGGGAKGLAHIGVLQWFEDNHIPIDFIAGTSMGGLIGGFYSAGYRPPEIREIVEHIDWDKVLTGAVPYRQLSFRRKEDFVAYPNSLEIGLRHGLSLPGGLNPGQSVQALMDRYMLPYSSKTSFDDLPIPFRCVAADLLSGKPVVFSSGSLAKALRATMSIPGVFAPVREVGKIYADGGLLNNLPTDVVKRMGADIVIGVHLSVGPHKAESLTSLLGVAGAATDVMIDANVLRGIEHADILITVDVAGYTTLDFTRAEQIIPKGVEAAHEKSGVLSRFNLNEEDWNRYLSQREARRVKSAPTPQFIEVTGTNPHLANQIRKAFEANVGQPIDTERIEKDISRLLGLGRFSTINYSVVERAGKQGLLIETAEEIESPPWLKPGFVIDGADPANVGFTFASRITFLDVGGYRSEARIDLAAGSVYAARAEYYHPFTPFTRWFIAPQIFATSAPVNLYSGDHLLAEYRQKTAGGAADIGITFDRFSELRLGYVAGYLQESRRIGSPLLPEVSGRTGATRLSFVTDHRDNPIIPRSGAILASEVRWVDATPGAAEHFPSARMTVEGFRPVSRRGSIYGVAEGGTTFGYQQTGIPQFFLGGPDRLAAFGGDQFRVNQYWYTRLGYLHRIGELPTFLGGGVYLTGEYEAAKPYGQHTSLDPAVAKAAVAIEKHPFGLHSSS
jgi:NTE family protein